MSCAASTASPERNAGHHLALPPVLARNASSCDTRSRCWRGNMARSATGGCIRMVPKGLGLASMQSRAEKERSPDRVCSPRSSVTAALVRGSHDDPVSRQQSEPHPTRIIRGPQGLTCRYVRPLHSQEHRE